MSAAHAILIVGATRGIRLELVKQALITYPSATIYATARNVSKAVDLQKLVQSSKGRVKIVAANATDLKSLTQASEEIKISTSVLDHVVYSAGVMAGFGNIFDVGVDSLKTNMETNVYGAYHTAVVFSPFLLKSDIAPKSLVLLASSYGSLALTENTFDLHQKDFGASDYDAIAMYNISKFLNCSQLTRKGIRLCAKTQRSSNPLSASWLGYHGSEPVGNIRVQESAAGILKVIKSFTGGEKNFISYTGDTPPW